MTSCLFCSNIQSLHSPSCFKCNISLSIDLYLECVPITMTLPFPSNYTVTSCYLPLFFNNSLQEEACQKSNKQVTDTELIAIIAES